MERRIVHIVTVLEAACVVGRAPVDAVAASDSVLTFSLAECGSRIHRAVGAQSIIGAVEVRAVEVRLCGSVCQAPCIFFSV
jgi:hypothetical protein